MVFELLHVQHADHPIGGTIHNAQEQRTDRKSGEIEHIALSIEAIEYAQLLAERVEDAYGDRPIDARDAYFVGRRVGVGEEVRFAKILSDADRS